MYRFKISFFLLKGMYVFWMCEKLIFVVNVLDFVVFCCYYLYCNIVCFYWYNWCKKKKRKIILYVLFIVGYYVYLLCYRNIWLFFYSNIFLFI